MRMAADRRESVVGVRTAMTRFERFLVSAARGSSIRLAPVVDFDTATDPDTERDVIEEHPPTHESLGRWPPPASDGELIPRAPEALGAIDTAFV